MNNINNKQRTNIAGGIVINPDKGIAIVNQNYNSWSIPKGHVEKKESILDAALREIYEETGLKNIQLIKNLGSYERYRIGLDGEDDFSELKLIHVFLFLTNEKELISLDKHNPVAQWASFNQANKLLTHPKDKDFLAQSIIHCQKYLN